MKDGPEAAAFIDKALGGAAQRVELSGIGTAVTRGPLATTLGLTDSAEAGPGGHHAPRRVFRRTTAAFSMR